MRKDIQREWWLSKNIDPTSMTSNNNPLNSIVLDVGRMTDVVISIAQPLTHINPIDDSNKVVDKCFLSAKFHHFNSTDVLKMLRRNWKTFELFKFILEMAFVLLALKSPNQSEYKFATEYFIDLYLVDLLNPEFLPYIKDLQSRFNIDTNTITFTLQWSWILREEVIVILIKLKLLWFKVSIKNFSFGNILNISHSLTNLVMLLSHWIVVSDVLVNHLNQREELWKMIWWVELIKQMWVNIIWTWISLSEAERLGYHFLLDSSYWNIDEQLH